MNATLGWNGLKESIITAGFKLSPSKYFEGSFVNRTQNSSKNSKPFWRLCVGRGSAVHPPSNVEGLRDIQHSINRILDTRFYIWFIRTRFYKTWQILLQNVTAILLENATEVYYKMNEVFYYKMRQLLIYYKLRQYNEKRGDVSLGKSTILILWTLGGLPAHFVLQFNQWFHDGLIFFFHYLLLLERTLGWALSPPHVRFCLLSI